MPPVVLNQTLHGYSDGHRLIATSLPMESAETRMMLVMSDLSGSGVKPEAGGYLTGYPLEKIGKYVFARTWLAAEMPRPGCVWTHSLIIDNSDLAKIASTEQLLTAFQRPGSDVDQARFQGPLNITSDSVPTRIVRSSRAHAFLSALYTLPDKSVIAETAGADIDEKLITSIWMQQWPRLRRSFSFCTLAGMDRSTKGADFDVQITPQVSRGFQAMHSNAVHIDSVDLSPEVKPLLSDLEEPQNGSLREFLRRSGGDVDRGRHAMVPLCRLYSCFSNKPSPDILGAIEHLAYFHSKGLPQARSVRSLIVDSILNDIERIDSRALAFLINEIDNNAALIDRIRVNELFGASLWKQAPRMFIELMNDDRAVGRFAKKALLELSTKELISGLRRDVSLTNDVIEWRSDILLDPEFWELPEIDGHLIELVDDEHIDEAVNALVLAGWGPPVPSIIERVSTDTLAKLVDSSTYEANAVSLWINAVSQNANKSAAILASRQISKLSTLVKMAQMMTPEFAPNEYGNDPWAISLESARGRLKTKDKSYLSAFLLGRALGRRTNSQATLIQFGYHDVHMALQRTSLSSDMESLIVNKLDSGGWYSWDHCTRLRQTVTRLFIEKNLEPAVFANLSNDDELAKALFDEAAKSWRGRRYLAKVRQEIKRHSTKASKARAKYIAGLIKVKFDWEDR